MAIRWDPLRLSPIYATWRNRKNICKYEKNVILCCDVVGVVEVVAFVGRGSTSKSLFAVGLNQLFYVSRNEIYGYNKK